MAWTLVAAGGVALFAAPSGTAAQQADGWWPWALEEVVSARDGRSATLPDVILGRDRDGRGQARGQARRGGGPPFCQNGQGHPVHGRQWCRDKGFGLGAGGVLRWDRQGWDDVILRSPRRNEPRRGTMDRGGLIDVLGDVILGRLDAEGRRQGAGQPLVGRWLTTATGASVLQLRAGSIPVAELTDLNGDGRVDAVLIARR